MRLHLTTPVLEWACQIALHAFVSEDRTRCLGTGVEAPRCDWRVSIEAEGQGVREVDSRGPPERICGGAVVATGLRSEDAERQSSFQEGVRERSSQRFGVRREGTHPFGAWKLHVISEVPCSFPLRRSRRCNPSLCLRRRSGTLTERSIRHTDPSGNCCSGTPHRRLRNLAPR